MRVSRCRARRASAAATAATATTATTIPLPPPLPAETVSVAVEVVVDKPAAVVKVAKYVLQLKARVVGLVVNDGDIAPEIAPPSAARRVAEPVNDHCTATYPVAAVVKVAVDPTDTDTDMGWRVTVGATFESYHTDCDPPSHNNTVAPSLESERAGASWDCCDQASGCGRVYLRR